MTKKETPQLVWDAEKGEMVPEPIEDDEDDEEEETNPRRKGKAR